MNGAGAAVIDWTAGRFRIQVIVDGRGRPRLTGIADTVTTLPAIALPLVELVTTARARQGGGRYDATPLGQDLVYTGHRAGADRLEIDVEGEDLRVTAVYEIRGNTLTTRAHIRTASRTPVTILFASSFAFDTGMPAADTRLHAADSTWLAENRWRAGTLEQLAHPDVKMAAHAGAAPRACVSQTGRGLWSTGEHIPVGAAETSSSAIAWQIASGSGWHWQVAQSPALDGLGTVRLVTSGAADAEHGWSCRLAEGDVFTTCDTTIAWSDAPRAVEECFRALTEHRRSRRVPWPDDPVRPLVFNDYMNALMADPTTSALLPLVDAAADAGAEVFVVDAGWYADEAGWWHTVGAWDESRGRFPDGLVEVMDAIRDAGMQPGLWLEPWAVGLDVPTGLPDAAFFCRAGDRLALGGRYRLDFRHPAVIARMTAVIDRLIAAYGIRYVKFDDNIDPVHGTDADAQNPADGLNLVAAAYLDWIAALRARHPDLTIENCASGGMRADPLTASYFALVSTSDQQDALAVAPIAASAPALLPPENAGVWSYPGPGMPPGVIDITLVNSILSRPILSGRLDLLDEAQTEAVQAWARAHKEVRATLPSLSPFWPFGLPDWNAPWVVWGLADATVCLLSLVRRDEDSPDELVVPGEFAGVTALYARAGTWALDHDGVRISLPSPGAMTLRLDVAG